MGETLESAQGPVIEPASARHARALAGVAAAAMSDPWSERALMDEVVHPQGHVWIAREDGPDAETFGFVAAREGPSELHILMLAVRPEWRRRGVGAELARTALRFAWDADLDAVHLEVRAGNDPAQALYGELGFVVVGTRPRYYRDGEHAVLMSLDLDFTRSAGSRTTGPRA